MKRLFKPLDVLKVDESLKFTKSGGFISPLPNHITSLIIIQDLYSCNSSQSALQYEGRQYSYNTSQEKRVWKALVPRAYNLKWRGKWYKR